MCYSNNILDFWPRLVKTHSKMTKLAKYLKMYQPNLVRQHFLYPDQESGNDMAEI